MAARTVKGGGSFLNDDLLNGDQENFVFVSQISDPTNGKSDHGVDHGHIRSDHGGPFIDHDLDLDLGLGTLNETRAALGLTPYTSFDQITHDQQTVQMLKAVYNNDINSVDLWIGALAEDHMNGAMIGQTFGLMIGQQFENPHDGDRLWLENQGFDAKTLSEIKQTTLSDIVERDTDTLVGGPKNDVLEAGTGQQMTGMAGSDTFVFDDAAISAVKAAIADFKSGVDKLQLENAADLSLRDVHISHDNGNLTLTVGDDQITLVGINPQFLRSQDLII